MGNRDWLIFILNLILIFGVIYILGGRISKLEQRAKGVEERTTIMGLLSNTKDIATLQEKVNWLESQALERRGN